MVEGTPPGYALPPPPQRTTPARNGTRCGAGAGSPRPHRPHPGHKGRGTLAACSRGRAAGEGTAPDTRRPSEGWQAIPPGDGPPKPPRHAPPQGMQAEGTVLGPHTHTSAPTARGWRTPSARPVGGQSGGGQRLTSDAPHNGGRHPPWGRPFRHPHSEQRRPAEAHAVGPVLGSHARTDRPRVTRVAEPLLPAPEDGRPGEGQRLTPDAPQNGGRPPPRGWPPTVPPARDLCGCAKAGEHEPEWYGDHAPHDRNDASDTRFVACPAKAEGRNEAERPPALQAPPATQTGGTGTGRPTPPQPAPRHTNGTDLPHGGRTASSQVGGRPPTTLAARSPHRACRPGGQCWAPTPTRPRPQHVGSGPRQPA